MNTSRGALPLMLAVMMIVLSCRTKDPCSDCEEPEDLLRAPIGLGFSSPAGDICGFSLATHEVTRTVPIATGYVGSAKINYSGDKLFLAEQSDYGVRILRLSDLSEMDWVVLPALPVEIELDYSASKIYILTRNGGFWTYFASAHEFDTLEVPIESRDFALKPPDQHEAWLVSPRDQSVNVIDLQLNRILHTIYLNHRPASVVFSLDGETCYISAYGSEGVVYVVHTMTRDITDTLAATSRIRDLAISEDGGFLAGADSSTGTIRVWNLDMGGHRDVSGPRFAEHLVFMRQSHDFFALDPSTGEMVRVSVTDTSATVVAEVQLPVTTTAFALWEQQP